MRRPIVSVIIPCFNSEKYIEECLTSIVEQNFADMEIICIDDGSTDRTRNIIEDFAIKYENFKTISLEHGGIVRAKKRGVKEAQGKYVLFIDSDDFVAKGMISKGVEGLEKNDVDAVYYGYYLKKGDSLSKCLPVLPEGIYCNKEICNSLYDIKKSRKNFNWAQWPYFLKKSIIETFIDIVDDDLSVYEDMVITWMYLINTKKIFICNESLYYYRVHGDSTGRRKNPDSLQCVNKAYNNLLSGIEGHIYEDILKKQLKYMMFDLVQCNTCFSNERQEFFMFPYELVPQGAKIVLYGAGYVGKSYYRQIRENNFCEIVLWCDANFESIRNEKYQIESIEAIQNTEYDYIVICNMHLDIAEEIKRGLERRLNTGRDKIITYEPRKMSRFVDFD